MTPIGSRRDEPQPKDADASLRSSPPRFVLGAGSLFRQFALALFASVPFVRSSE
jgi:hypothetical protein